MKTSVKFSFVFLLDYIFEMPSAHTAIVCFRPKSCVPQNTNRRWYKDINWTRCSEPTRVITYNEN